MAALPGLCVENRTSCQLCLNFTLFQRNYKNDLRTSTAPTWSFEYSLGIRTEASKPKKMVFRSALIGLVWDKQYFTHLIPGHQSDRKQTLHIVMNNVKHKGSREPTLIIAPNPPLRLKRSQQSTQNFLHIKVKTSVLCRIYLKTSDHTWVRVKFNWNLNQRGLWFTQRYENQQATGCYGRTVNPPSGNHSWHLIGGYLLNFDRTCDWWWSVWTWNLTFCVNLFLEMCSKETSKERGRMEKGVRVDGRQKRKENQ